MRARALPGHSGKAFLFVRARYTVEFLRSLTPETFDTLIIVIIILGLAFAAVRLYRDFTRPLPPLRPKAEPPKRNR
jgi:hypothetical protein